MTDNNDNPQNQRNQKRISTRRPAEILVNDQLFSAVMINLSLEGIGLISDTCFKEGDQIKIKFDLPGYEQSSQLALNGAVTHRTNVNKKCMIGVQFSLLSLHENLVITGFINYHQRLG